MIFWMSWASGVTFAALFKPIRANADFDQAQTIEFLAVQPTPIGSVVPGTQQEL